MTPKWLRPGPEFFGYLVGSARTVSRGATNDSANSSDVPVAKLWLRRWGIGFGGLLRRVGRPAGEEPLEAADHVSFGVALVGAASDVVDGGLVESYPYDG